MAITIKTQEQIVIMRQAGKILADLCEVLKEHIRPGVSTKKLDKIAENFIISRDAKPSFKGYNGFPCSLCTSINEEIVHGIPTGLRKLESGDIISIDMGAYFNGFHGDCARTYAVGEISEEKQKLINVTEQSFFEGIKYAKNGFFLNQIGEAIQQYVEKNGFSVIREYVGHGIGTQIHEDPAVPNYKTVGKGPRLQKGMVLAIEPMVNAGTYKLKVLKDGWTAVSKDGRPSAHYENTVLITEGEPEIFTLNG